MIEDILPRWAAHAFALGMGFSILLLLAEAWWPRARSQTAFGRRWLANLLTYLSTLLAFRWLPHLSLVGAALLAEQKGWGLFNWLAAPQYLSAVIACLAVDLAGYVTHRLTHHSPLLWRIHRLHHSDLDVDVTTAYRVHPFEVLLFLTVRVAIVVAVGMPPVAALAYLLLATLTGVLSHANLRLPPVLDRSLGVIVVTPDIHRTHHSIDVDDSNSNFGVCLSCWDRLFGTFRSAPKLGFGSINFGVEGRTVEDSMSILRMLADPFLPERVRTASKPLVTMHTTDARHGLG